MIAALFDSVGPISLMFAAKAYTSRNDTFPTNCNA